VEGLWWYIIEEHVLKSYPALIRVFDASRNASTHTATAESEITGLNKLIGMWAKDEANGIRGNYLTYVAIVVRSRPPWQDSIMHFVPFLQAHAGGVKITDWREFQARRSHSVASADRKMAGPVFLLLAGAKDTPLVYAVLYAAYLCPEGTQDNKYCVWFSAADFNRIIVAHKPKDCPKQKADKVAAQKKLDAEANTS
jgi:hypothetical protein